MKGFKIILGLLIVVLFCILLAVSGNAKKTVPDDNTFNIFATITRDEKYDAAVLSLSQEEFENGGFVLGDSVDVVFENGYTLTDIPYYNGYYVKTGNPLVVAYPGFDNVYITFNNKGIFTENNFKEGDTVTVTLNTTGKYSPVQDALGQLYSFNRDDYESDEQFCNFRSISVEGLKENLIYRGASPVDNSRGRAAYTDSLLEQNGIRLVIDVADTEADYEYYRSKEDFNSHYFESLNNEGKVVFLGMGSSYENKEYKESLVKGLREIANSDGPVYIHCMEGKDRTGFMCMLLGALSGGSYEDLMKDYMITYYNYYDVDYEATPEKYDAIVDLYFDTFTEYMTNTNNVEDLKKADFAEAAKHYLLSGGMSETEIEQLKEFISE